MREMHVSGQRRSAGWIAHLPVCTEGVMPKSREGLPEFGRLDLLGDLHRGSVALVGVFCKLLTVLIVRFLSFWGEGVGRGGWSKDIGLDLRHADVGLDFGNADVGLDFGHAEWRLR
jgi:hypothetical protein